jgi:predicted RNase H-like nuclease
VAIILRCTLHIYPVNIVRQELHAAIPNSDQPVVNVHVEFNFVHVLGVSFMMQKHVCRMGMQSTKEATSQMCVWHPKYASKVWVQPFCTGHKKLHNLGVSLSLTLSNSIIYGLDNSTLQDSCRLC